MAEDPKPFRMETASALRYIRRPQGDLVASAALGGLVTKDEDARTLIFYMEGTPGYGLFLEMDPVRARQMGELLILHADSFKPTQKPEVRNRKP